MQYRSVNEIAKKWNVSERSVRNYCAHGRVDGAFLTGKTWNIPENAEKPERSNKKKEQPITLLDILKEQKVSIIYISHRMEELFRMTDRITVIRDGAYVGTVNTKETDTDELVAMMVGRSLQNYYTRDYDTLKEDRVVLEVENLTKKGVFDNISFKVRQI